MIDPRFTPELRSKGEVERLAILRTYEVVDAKGTATLDNALIIAAHIAACPAAFMVLVEADRLIYKATYGFVPEADSVERSGSFADLVLANGGKPLIITDAASESDFAVQYAANDGIRFFAGFPVVAAKNHIVGVVGCFDHTPHHLGPGQIDALERVAENTMVAFELRRALHNARHQALTDTLTGVGNRHAFFENGERLFAMRPPSPRSALLYVDLDGFKQLNDCHGHHAGDLALCLVADCIRRNIRSRDFAARIGGDEFAILLSECDDHDAVSERIRQEVRSELQLQGWNVTASVGLLTFHKPPCSVSDALAAADALMYRAKQAGKDRVASAAYQKAGRTRLPAPATV